MGTLTMLEKMLEDYDIVIKKEDNEVWVELECVSDPDKSSMSLGDDLEEALRRAWHGSCGLV